MLGCQKDGNPTYAATSLAPLSFGYATGLLLAMRMAALS
jgi:hypothetical protein